MRTGTKCLHSGAKIFEAGVGEKMSMKREDVNEQI